MTKNKTIQAPPSGTVIYIPLDKLRKSPRNARTMPHPKADIEALAASIGAHSLLQSPVVEPDITPAGTFTGKYFVTIGEGRRQALLLRVKRKQTHKDEPILCRVEDDANSFEISLAENAIRSPMHPADQFDAFQKMQTGHGLTIEDIAARFGVTPAVVKQRLKLAAVSPVLMQAYRDDELNLDQLTAFAITDDHARQQEVWELLGADGDRADILGALNNDAIDADDRRALFVGLEAYQEAGGAILRDLFDDQQEGSLTDPVLLTRLAQEKLDAIAEAVKAEGWKWIEVMPSYDHAFAADMRRIDPHPASASDAVQEQIDALEEQYDALAGDTSWETTVEAERLEGEIAKLRGDDVFDPEDIARAGVIVCIGSRGEPRIERGYVRRDDDAGRNASPKKPKLPSDGSAPLPESLIADLTAHRTMALRNALAQQSDTALRAVVHALACAAFFPHSERKSCLNIRSSSAYLTRYAETIEETASAKEIAARNEKWIDRIPDDAGDMWTFVLGLDQTDLLALLAVCASHTINAVVARDSRDTCVGHADQLAHAVQLDMRSAWQPTAKGYFLRVSKERILEAVREGVSVEAAANLATMKKAAMAEAAQQRMADRGWLPEVLRAPSADAEEARNAA